MVTQGFNFIPSMRMHCKDHYDTSLMNDYLSFVISIHTYRGSAGKRIVVSMFMWQIKRIYNKHDGVNDSKFKHWLCNITAMYVHTISLFSLSTQSSICTSKQGWSFKNPRNPNHQTCAIQRSIEKKNTLLIV